MREKQKILIATTNKGKFEEARHILMDLPFDFLSLSDVGYNEKGPEEKGSTLLENAMLKAIYYGDRYQMITLCDDTGLYINALDGWPGIFSARIAESGLPQCETVLEKIKGVPESHRGASLKNSIVTYDPVSKDWFSSCGEVRGHIAAHVDRSIPTHYGFGYDPIFFYGPMQKTFSQMTLAEKNAVSHRGKSLSRMKFILQNQYGGKHLVVPVALIVKNGQILMSKRNDPFRPAFHEKWEFPGGKMDIGESLEENLIREVYEEVGLTVAPVKRLSTLWVEHQNIHSDMGGGYQVYLIPYVCRIMSGQGHGSDAEVIETRWLNPEEVTDMDLIGSNKIMYQELLPEFLECIAKESL